MTVSFPGGSGIWNNSTNNWTNSSGTVNTACSENGTAVFGAPGGTVTLAAPISATGLIFGSTGYVINSSSFALTLLGPAATISVANSATATISALIAGYTAGLTVSGAGTLILSGANTYTGATNVQAGTLQIGNGFTPGASIATSSSVTVNPGATLAVELASGETFTNNVTDNGTLHSLAGSGANNTQTVSGQISGTGSLLAVPKVGLRTWRISIPIRAARE